MNDNNPPDDDLPEWVWKIVDKHDLCPRSDRPIGGVSVLLHDAAFDVRELAATVHREQVVTAKIKEDLRSAIDMLTDAERLLAV